MTLKECTEQLTYLRNAQEEFLDGKYNPELDKDNPVFKDNPFVNDIKAIDTVLAVIDDFQEARKLLRAAVDDFGALGSELDEHCELDTFDCSKCPVNNGGNCRAWRLKKAALKIIDRRY